MSTRDHDHSGYCGCAQCDFRMGRASYGGAARQSKLDWAHLETVCACGRAKLVCYASDGVFYHCKHCDRPLDAR